jgi:glucan-binding YG repeat protein
MLTNQLVEDGDNYYYVDANGAMVRNTWVAIAADEDEEEDVDYRWYYFGASGKAYKSSPGKTINGKKYGFDDEGKMLFGFVDADNTSINTEDDAILSCTYYYGTNDDGARHTGWLRYEDGFDTTDYDDKDYEYYWFYFGSNGKKVANNPSKKINGNKYYFDENGVMITEWADGAATASQSRYFNANLENGSLEKNQWIWTSAPDSWGIDDEDDHWFRTNNEGKIIADGQTKKINSKWYVFDDWGRMQYGLVVLDKEKVSGANWVQSIDEDVYTADDIYDIESGNIYYFSNNEETDGAMKTGSSITISLADDDYVFGFDKSTGRAFNGVEGSKVYRNGIRQEADDDKYKAVMVEIDGKEAWFLVNSTGTLMKEKKYYKNDDDEYLVVLAKGSKTDGYTIIDEGIDDVKLARQVVNAADRAEAEQIIRNYVPED